MNMVKIRRVHGQMNTMIHKFWNFKIKLYKLLARQLGKFLKFQLLLLLFNYGWNGKSTIVTLIHGPQT